MEMLMVLANTGGDHHWWFPIFPLLWTALIIGAVYFFMRRRRGDGMNRAREILAERYASGELTVEEYRQRLGQLS
jgi:LPXTG-motif cell wall-anchored protein